MAAAVEQKTEELVKPEDAAAPVEEPAVSKEAETSIQVKDKDATVDPETVKAPGIMERVKEEVDAVGQALKSDEAAAPPASEEKTPKNSKKSDVAGLFKRLLKKVGWGSKTSSTPPPTTPAAAAATT